MGPYGYLIFFLLVVHSCKASTQCYDTSSLNRSSFPTSFIFGTSSSAYQYEGGANEGGRGSSIWDTFTHKYPGKIKDHSNGDVAVDFYHRYKDDVRIMKEIGFDSFRFSISWPRILPRGKLCGGVNEEGIKYYNNLINTLLSEGIEPFVTLFHWDVPQALEDEYGGFLSPKIVGDFEDFAELCFKEFGDRVKYWITLNEPSLFSNLGYALGRLAPGRCSSWQQLNCSGGDSATEPYIVSHHLLLAHASALKTYKSKYQCQKGKIGISLAFQWVVPYSEERHDQDAATRAIDFSIGWFMEPLRSGRYPDTMRYLVGNRLPQFSSEQSKMLQNSFDFIGLNYYTSSYAVYSPKFKSTIKVSYVTDSQTELTNEKNGVSIGPKDGSSWIYVYPRGIYEILLYMKRTYDNPLVYITENGIDEVNNASTLEEALNDGNRIDYHHQHLSYVHLAMKHGANVKGYFVWSLLDDFEWSSGYTIRFGINYVDYKNNLKRYSKHSTKWFKNFLEKGA